MDQYQLIVTIAAGALTLFAFGGKIWNSVRKGFAYVFFRPYIAIRTTIDERFIQLSERIEQVSERQEIKILEMNAMSAGLLAILHDRVFQACMYFIEKESISCDELENLEYLYRGYSGLGGNGTCETLMIRVRTLQITN